MGLVAYNSSADSLRIPAHIPRETKEKIRPLMGKYLTADTIYQIGGYSEHSFRRKIGGFSLPMHNGRYLLDESTAGIFFGQNPHLRNEGRSSKHQKEQSVTAHMDLVRKIASRVCKERGLYGILRDEVFEDFVSAGFLGLVDSYNRFEISRGTKFEAFAPIRIRGAIIDYMRGNLPMSRHTKAIHNSIATSAETLEKRLGRQPFENEIASETGITLKRYKYHEYRAGFFGIPVSYGIAPPEKSENLFQKNNSKSQLDEIIESHNSEILSSAVNQLTLREQIIIRRYYFEDATMEQIAKELDVKNSRISQLHARAIGRLRDILSQS